MGSNCVDLWVRAGSDGVRNGADPVCQQIFMILLLKADPKKIDETSGEDPLSFNVKTVVPAKPHEEFRSAGLRHVPGIVHNGEVYEQPDEIIEYVDTNFPKPSLQYFDTAADNAVADLFKKFCFFIREVNKDSKGLDGELRRVNDFLKETGNKFLTGNQMTHLDCRILPYLQHIRIAAEILKGYSLPDEYESLWKYMEAGYSNEAFTKSCPADQEIILYWAERKDTPNLSHTKIAEIAKQQPVFSFSRK